MHPPEVAVVIPARDAESTIGAAIDSVRSQPGVAISIIVVDDASVDATASIAASVPGVRVLSGRGRGPGAARNIGIAHTRAPFVAFLDADDLRAAGALHLQVERLVSRPDALLVSGEAEVFEHHPGDTGLLLGRPDGPIVHDWNHADLVVGNSIPMSTVVARRSALEAVNAFDESPELVGAEDYHLWLRLAARGRLVHLPRVAAHYRASTDSLVGLDPAKVSDAGSRARRALGLESSTTPAGDR